MKEAVDLTMAAPEQARPEWINRNPEWKTKIRIDLSGVISLMREGWLRTISRVADETGAAVDDHDGVVTVSYSEGSDFLLKITAPGNLSENLWHAWLGVHPGA